MYRIVAMGDRDSVTGFRALGMEACVVNTAEEGKAALYRLAKEEVGIIYMTEQLAALMPGEIDKYQESLTPAIILIPGKDGTLGIGAQKVTTTVERAVGADII